MELVGRITKDAVVNQLKDERNVVNFSIAVNDYYTPKNGEGVNVTTYYNCSYWVNSKIVHLLTKGRLGKITVALISRHTWVRTEMQRLLSISM